MRVSGCNGRYEIVLVAEAKAKTVTSLLIIPSVLGFRCMFTLILLFNLINNIANHEIMRR
jgi:hypothetical protein